ncbi:MGH1-like glycoside hydrolase domain-containing protein [Fibrella aquatilis]|uniref:Glucosidase n=1 Tax=Fibrella aquatilis TaxID=2817059 RepID=A0A939G4Q0_9BACT|nr:glucosidase [Fibrella aquatilis]MBO0932322.1 glucosidase [Fibrella aquatilis]
MTTEQQRIDAGGNWLTWGPYLSERQWGTVREDYSPHGTAWDSFPHDHARSRVYRWGEDGLAGISDNRQRLCFALALWNGRDPILKERLFGLAGPEGNHGEDVKELYYYLDSTPTHSYMKQLYKYPQAEFPYADLLRTNQTRTRQEPEYELLDTGILSENNYFDVVTEYAKAGEEDILIRITVHNRASQSANLTVLPTLWFRNLWSFGLLDEMPSLTLMNPGPASYVAVRHPELPAYNFYFQPAQQTLFTDNETNTERLYNVPNASPFVKDAFHRAVIDAGVDELAGRTTGTKCAPLYALTVAGGGHETICLRLAKGPVVRKPFGEFDTVFAQRQREADDFYRPLVVANPQLAAIQRQAFAGMLWSKQYYNIDIPRWLAGDPGQAPPPASRKTGRNHQWESLNNEDIISMPDKWEYPWYAAWDLAFHCIPLAMIDSAFAKAQLLLFLREWYMHPNGQIPAYEWAFGDVNPPVHAWACWQVYQLEKGQKGAGDVVFLKKAFHKLSLNFTWWVNRKDAHGKNVFEGGFLGLDNIGVFDRSAPMPGGGRLEQADGTAWMGMYCLNMLEIALEITRHDPAFEDMATKFFEHFVYIAESLNRMSHDMAGSWDEAEGFFYDVLTLPDGRQVPLKVRSLVGLSTLFAVLPLTKSQLDAAPDFAYRLNWFAQYRAGLANYQVVEATDPEHLLLSLIPPRRLQRLLQAMLDEAEFLAPGGIRSISKRHQHGYQVDINGDQFGLRYDPAESSTGAFGGNSNWRGPIWMPMNYLLIQALGRYDAYYGDTLQVEYPTGSGQCMQLGAVAAALTDRLVSLFVPDITGSRPLHGDDDRYRTDPHFRDLVLFYEYFHGDTGRGVGASHQTGWTGVVAHLIAQTYPKPATPQS